MNPFHNCWPTYRDNNEYYNDFVFCVQVPQKQIRSFTEFLSEQPPDGGNISAQWCIQSAQKMKADFQRQFPPQYQGRPDYSQSQSIN